MKGEPGTCKRDEVDFIDVSANQFTSVATSLIPFLEHDDANRALMGSNMQRQGVPSIVPNAPLVGTGQEDRAAHDSEQVILAEEDGVVTEADGHAVSVKGVSVKKYPILKFVRSNQSTCLSQRPIVAVGDKVKKGDVLADGPATDNGVLSLGQNLLVAFVPWRGGNFEDAIILSERVRAMTVLPQFTLRHLSAQCAIQNVGITLCFDVWKISGPGRGFVRIGAVRASDILVGKISPKVSRNGSGSACFAHVR